MAEGVHSLGSGLFKIAELALISEMDVRSASFHPVDPVLACGLFKGGLVFLRGSNHTTPFKDWEIEPKHHPYERTILSVQWNVDGTKVAAGSDDGTVIVWCYPGDKKQEFCRKGVSNFPLIVWNPFNRDALASFNLSDDKKQVVIGNSATENPLTHSIESNLNCLTVAWMSHNQLACGYDDGTFEIHEIELNNSQMESRMVQKIRHDFGDHGLCRFIISITDFKLIKRAYVSTIAINKELDLLASSGTDQRIKIWSLGSNDPILVLDLDSYGRSMVWNSDIKEEIHQKTFIACGLVDGDVVIWYPFERENQTRKLTGHLNQIYQVLLSPDGRYLASTDYYKKLIIWSTKSWESIYIIPSSSCMYPYVMTWDAASSKLAISERKGLKQFNVIEEDVVAEKCCAGCKKTFQNLKLCARCNSIFYCSKECQCSHWPLHKLVCHKKE